MRHTRTFMLAAAFLGVVIGGPMSAQITVRMTADNFYAAYTGTPTAATARHFTGAWPGVATPAPFPPAGPVFYAVAWDDGAVFQGLLGSVAMGNGLVPTGSPLWEVCAANQPLPQSASGAPTTAALTAQIALCNKSNGWHAPSAGPNNDAASTQQTPGGQNLWGKVAAIEPTAKWIWNTNATPQCAGTNGFLQGGCNPGEYLIFRLRLDRVAECRPPVPSFTIDWTAGYGSLTANGTASQFELNHFWSVEESNASWNRFPPEIMQWFPGPAGVFDLKTFYETGAKRRLKCDAYYRVKLAVSNNCISWRETTRLVRLKCCPGEVSAPARSVDVKTTEAVPNPRRR